MASRALIARGCNLQLLVRLPLQRVRHLLQLAVALFQKTMRICVCHCKFLMIFFLQHEWMSADGHRSDKVNVESANAWFANVTNK